MSKYNWDLNQIKEAVKDSINYTEVLEKLQIPRQGNNSSTLKRILKENNIDYSHFTGRAREYKKKEETPISDYLSNKVKITSSKLKDKLIKSGLKENKCENPGCGINSWHGKPIICQLHHINGDHNDNRLENLQILCPNCHSQTDNYCGNSNKNVTKYYCPDCGKEILKGSKYCVICSGNHLRKIKRPSAEILLQDFKELQAFTKIGEKYNVSDKSIANWFKSYNLPYTSKELKLLIDSHSEATEQYSR